MLQHRRSVTELVAYAVQTNHCEDIRSFILDGFPIDSRDNNFDPKTFPMTLSCFAVYENAIDVLLVLIELGANVNLPTLDGQTPIHMAIQSSYNNNRTNSSIDMTEAMIKLLIFYGADVFASDCMNEKPPHGLTFGRAHNSQINTRTWGRNTGCFQKWIDSW